MCYRVWCLQSVWWGGTVQLDNRIDNLDNLDNLVTSQLYQNLGNSTLVGSVWTGNLNPKP